MRSRMVPILSPWPRAKSIRSSSRAMPPSSRMISQMTALALRPASRATSTAASVCPARTSTPPGRATSGNICPGETRASGPFAASIATAIVRARSAALIPVEIPSVASIETVKAVPLRLRLVRAMGSSPSWSARSFVKARQISPRPNRAMKLIASGVAICAGMTRSPSFSRSSSSTRMNIRPLRASSISSSGEERKPCFSTASSGLGTKRLHALQIAGEHVDLEIDGPARLNRAQCSDGGGVGNEVEHEMHALGPVLDRVHGQRHAVDGDRALGRDIRRDLVACGDRHAVRAAFLVHVDDRAHAVDMPGNDMPAQFVAELQGTFEVELAPFGPLAGRGARHGLCGDVEGDAAGRLVDHGQAHARARDRGAEVDRVDVVAGGYLDAQVALLR